MGRRINHVATLARLRRFSKSNSRILVIRRRVNFGPHLADVYKNADKGNRFVSFGESGITLSPDKSGNLRVKANRVDVFTPKIANLSATVPTESSPGSSTPTTKRKASSVRHSYFHGANDPCNALMSTLKPEIDPEA